MDRSKKEMVTLIKTQEVCENVLLERKIIKKATSFSRKLSNKIIKMTKLKRLVTSTLQHLIMTWSVTLTFAVVDCDCHSLACFRSKVFVANALFTYFVKKYQM